MDVTMEPKSEKGTTKSVGYGPIGGLAVVTHLWKSWLYSAVSSLMTRWLLMASMSFVAWIAIIWTSVSATAVPTWIQFIHRAASLSQAPCATGDSSVNRTQAVSGSWV